MSLTKDKSLGKDDVPTQAALYPMPLRSVSGIAASPAAASAEQGVHR
jgi:hypothetical protein